MIDIHHHCLPGVDDGPASLDEAVELCRIAADEGIETIIATPHVLRGRWRNVPREELEGRLEDLRARTAGRPRILLGSEYFFAHDMAEVLRAGSTVIPLAGSRYVLVELAANSVPPMIDRPLHAVQLDGWTPVIAHPERNLVFQRHPDLLATLVGIGVKVQITASSLTGGFGPAARTAARTMLRRQLVHFVATDAHSVAKRPPAVREAAAALEELGGEALVRALMTDNPRAVIEGRGLPWDPEPLAEPDGLLTRVRRFFRIGRA